MSEYTALVRGALLHVRAEPTDMVSRAVLRKIWRTAAYGGRTHSVYVPLFLFAVLVVVSMVIGLGRDLITCTQRRGSIVRGK